MSTIPMSEMMRTGLRPRRSETEPHQPVVNAERIPIDMVRRVDCRR